ncbi:thiolase family protein [Aeromicrobium phragmitis]|uniref:propanoyl-CoA C-acyltransferase n=1 Tax=Aeromicrobium phragmitis TaxID=2478914 RepID=A0A3L8PLH5_9ACTN|nr:thiolase family protein [Aeromicrobium phragmitis]RLV55593.1 thiolase family protein [Aeromicrobium phragmitis]
MREVCIAGIGMTPFGRFPATSVRDLSAAAVRGALADAAVGPEQVGAVYFANAVQGFLHGQEMIRAQAALRDTGLLGHPMMNVENACASGSTAVNLAWMAVGSGQVDIAVVVGAEKLTHPHKQRSLDAIATAVDLDEIDQLRAALSRSSDEGDSGSLFMDIYADAARRFAERSGATQRDFAAVASKNREHAALNPIAQFREPMSVEDVLSARQVSGPLTLPMCSPIGDGAAAMVLCARHIADAAPAPVVTLAASSLVSGQTSRSDHGAVGRAAAAAYESAAVAPDELDVVEVHDAAAPAELIALEELGIFDPGESLHALSAGVTRLGGRMPVNPSGGLISRGHPIGATGCAQLVELVLQLRGGAGQRQIAGARVALAENVGGHLGPDPAVACVTILKGAGAT